ncbi:MAG: geranylgeranyl reductase family protein [Bacteroidetes bacterium]|nr:geranylgeranyl reductase family protein [Bacteroidota bacterium]
MKTASRYDVVIAGAGPAGLVSALNLTGHGYRIALIDKSAYPREKTCGDALSGKALAVLKRLPGGIYHDFLNIPRKTPSTGIRFVSPAGTVLDLPFPEIGSQDPPGYLIKRSIFDHFLLEKVKHCRDIDVFESRRIDDVILDSEGVVIHCEGSVVRCSVVVGADGAHSMIARKLTTIRNTHRQHSTGIRAYYQDVAPGAPTGFIELHFLKEILPGYLWIFPMAEGQFNVGLGVQSSWLKKSGVNLPRWTDQLISDNSWLSDRFAQSKRVTGWEGWGLPMDYPKRKVAGERFLLCGDAAGLVDPFSGEGIGNAMFSGEMAARHILRCLQINDFSVPSMNPYVQELHKSLDRELRTSRIMQKLAYSASLFNFVTSRATRNEKIRKMMMAMYTDMDVKSELTRPGFYFRLLFG